jgi:hypothetical protein
LLALHSRELGRPGTGGAALLFLIGAAALYFGALVYGFAIDPKPRMFLPVAAVACVTIGVLGASAWQGGRRQISLCILVVIGLQATASAWVRGGGDPVAAATRPLPVK